MCDAFYTYSAGDAVYAGIFPAFEAGVATASWSTEGFLREYEGWGYGKKEAAARQPAATDVPTLILAGEMDTLCPPAWARDAASSLTNVHLFEIPGFAHSPTFSGECPASLALQFMADPSKAPDASCLEGMEIAFALPEEEGGGG
jgi:pimeloyl-ACP methyl ester carboxylesterase